MGALADAWRWADANLFGGLLPGGHEVSAPGATIAGVIPTPFVGVQPAAQPAANGAGVPALFGGAAQSAAMGMPTSAPRGPYQPRGKTVTGVARVMPDGSVVPVRMMPGLCIVTTADLATVKRVKKAHKLLARAFPAPRKKRRKYCAPRTTKKK